MKLMLIKIKTNIHQRDIGTELGRERGRRVKVVKAKKNRDTAVCREGVGTNAVPRANLAATKKKPRDTVRTTGCGHRARNKSRKKHRENRKSSDTHTKATLLFRSGWLHSRVSVGARRLGVRGGEAGRGREVRDLKTSSAAGVVGARRHTEGTI